MKWSTCFPIFLYHTEHNLITNRMRARNRFRSVLILWCHHIPMLFESVLYQACPPLTLAILLLVEEYLPAKKAVGSGRELITVLWSIICMTFKKSLNFQRFNFLICKMWGSSLLANYNSLFLTLTALIYNLF